MTLRDQPKENESLSHGEHQSAPSVGRSVCPKSFISRFQYARNLKKGKIVETSALKVGQNLSGFGWVSSSAQWLSSRIECVGTSICPAWYSCSIKITADGMPRCIVEDGVDIPCHSKAVWSLMRPKAVPPSEIRPGKGPPPQFSSRGHELWTPRHAYPQYPDIETSALGP